VVISAFQFLLKSDDWSKAMIGMDSVKSNRGVRDVIAPFATINAPRWGIPILGQLGTSDTAAHSFLTPAVEHFDPIQNSWEK